MTATRPVTDALRNSILEGKLLPGERLVELQLCETYGVSRAAIRSAIGDLVKEGLVDHEANKGATVRRVAIDEAIQITEVRTILESLVAERAATNASSAECDELSHIVLSMREAVAGDEPVTYSELNSLLHRRLREISGHQVASDLIGLLRNRSAHHNYRLALIPGRPSESLPQHEAIVAAVVAGDGQGAGQAMRAHLESVMSILRRWEAAESR
jgi:DNA-binding GntR family transcriptional regulator